MWPIVVTPDLATRHAGFEHQRGVDVPADFLSAGRPSGVHMQITVTQILALALLSLSLARSSSSFLSLVERLKQSSTTSFPRRIAYAVCASVAALPDFFCSSKAVDFVILLAKV